MAWILCLAGVLFCLAGIYEFRKRAFEENKSIGGSLLIMVMGIILVAIGTAKYFAIIR